jgi:hypothetical protein
MLSDSFCLKDRPPVEAFLLFIGKNISATAFRIVAPPTRQGATLQKNRLPDARTIVDGVMLDVENSSKHDLKQDKRLEKKDKRKLQLRQSAI